MRSVCQTIDDVLFRYDGIIEWSMLVVGKVLSDNLLAFNRKYLLNCYRIDILRYSSVFTNIISFFWNDFVSSLFDKFRLL